MNPKDNAKLDEKTGCLVWQGRLWNHGYGYFPGHKLAHRISYLMNVGVIPKGLCVLHHCDNKKCVNPEHLWLGTYKDNNRDKEKKGRANHHGVPASEKVREAFKEMGRMNRGRKHSEKARTNMGLARLGKKRGHYKKHKIWTAEERMAVNQKIRESRLGTKIVKGHFVKIN